MSIGSLPAIIATPLSDLPGALLKSASSSGIVSKRRIWSVSFSSACRSRVYLIATGLKVAPERGQLAVALVPLVQLVAFDDAAESVDLVDEVPARIEPDLALPVERLPLAGFEVDDNPARASKHDVEDRAVTSSRQRSFQDPHTLAPVPGGGDEERGQPGERGRRRELEGERAPARSRIAEDCLPVGNVHRLRNESVEPLLNVPHRWASFNDLRSAAWAALSVAPTVPAVTPSAAAIAS